MLQHFVKKRKRTFYLLSVTAILILTMVIAIQIPIRSNSNVIDSPSSHLAASASTDWTNPDLLSDNSYVFESWSLGNQEYFYSTYSLSTYDYHLVWLHFLDSSYDMDLYLYSDSSYLNLIDDSMRGYSEEWLIYKPISSGYVYPKAYTDSSTGNTGYIEVEAGFDISVGASNSVYLSSSEMGELFEVYLSSSNTYTIGLSVPIGADYDLYVCRVAAGSCTENDLHSDTSGTRSIIFKPLYSDDYAIVIIRRSGAGTCTLSVKFFTPVPGFEMVGILIGTISALGITLLWFKKQKASIL